MRQSFVLNEMLAYEKQTNKKNLKKTPRKQLFWFRILFLFLYIYIIFMPRSNIYDIFISSKIPS